MYARALLLYYRHFIRASKSLRDGEVLHIRERLEPNQMPDFKIERITSGMSRLFMCIRMSSGAIAQDVAQPDRTLSHARFIRSKLEYKSAPFK